MVACAQSAGCAYWGFALLCAARAAALRSLNAAVPNVAGQTLISTIVGCSAIRLFTWSSTRPCTVFDHVRRAPTVPSRAHGATTAPTATATFLTWSYSISYGDSGR